jgi:general secretion pathway protein G
MTVQRATRATARTAFTLLEILVVVAIIVVLAGIGGYYLLPRVDEAKMKTAKLQVKALTEQCEIYKLNNDDFPQSLEALTTQQPNGGPPLIPADSLLDPWGQPYGYNMQGPNNGGLKPDIWVNRPTGQIGNWPGSGPQH